MTSVRLADSDRLQAALGDRYVVEREVARGGWAAVYRAQDRKHDRVVAIKVFHPELAHTLGPERFLQEIRLAASFQHPYILPLYDSGETAESLYYVMPFIAGETLRERIAREGQVPVGDAVAIACDVLAALAHAHDRGVLHRDIKPENILLSGGHALVADFGIARAVRVARGERLSRPGIAVGTPAYMAPEQALGGDDADGRSDVYSVAAMLYEMLAGRPPYPEATMASVLDRHAVDEQPAPLETLRPDVPEDLAAAVMRGLALLPDDRYPTATAFADVLAPRITPVGHARASMELASRTGVARRRRVAIAGVALLATAAAAWFGAARRGDGGAEPTAVAVFPFTVRGGTEHEFLASGMVDLLSANLDGAGETRAVDAAAVLGAVADRASDTGAVTPTVARALAARLKADRFVLGSVIEDGGRLRIHATLYDASDIAQPVAQAGADGGDGQLFALVDELATELIAGARPGPGARLSRLAAVTTQSLPALKTYLRGEAHLRRGHPDSALARFGEALMLDTTFGLAAYRRAVAADWVANFHVAREAGERALALSRRLSGDDRRLLEAFLAWHRGDAARAEQLYRAALRERPDDVEAWYQLGEVLFHYGPLRGQRIAAAYEPLAQAHALDPQTGHVTLHLLDIAARAGDDERFESLLAEMRLSGNILLRRRAARDIANGDAATRARTLAALDEATEGTVVVTVGGLANYRRDLVAAVEVARLLTAPTRAPAVRGYGHVLLAQLAWARGRPREAARHLDAAAAHDSVLGMEFRAYGALLRWNRAPLAEIEAARARLLGWNGAPIARADSGIAPVAAHDSVHGALRQYLVGMLSVRLGDFESATATAGVLDTLSVSVREGSLPRDLARAVRAEAAHARHDDASALALLEGMQVRVPLERVANSPFFAGSLERWARAELLRERGRLREARGWYESIGESRPDIAFIVPATFRLAQVREATGDRAGALAAYREVAVLWRDCEPALRGWRDEAVAAVARLAPR